MKTAFVLKACVMQATLWWESGAWNNKFEAFESELEHILRDIKAFSGGIEQSEVAAASVEFGAAIGNLRTRKYDWNSGAPAALHIRENLEPYQGIFMKVFRDN